MLESCADGPQLGYLLVEAPREVRHMIYELCREEEVRGHNFFLLAIGGDQEVRFIISSI